MAKSTGIHIIKQYKIKLATVFIWILIWEGLSRLISLEMILPSPGGVLRALLDLFFTSGFWHTILFSSARIILGFVGALIIGILLAVLSYISRIFKELISLPLSVAKATPIASFIILALIWIRARNLSILISFITVLPMVYTNVLQGLYYSDEKLLQMAKVFHISFIKKLKAIYVPSVIPHLIAAITVGLGFSWKAGIAAEIIGIPNGSIGIQLYKAKLYIMTKEVFAWTIVIILISIFFEKTVLMLIRKLNSRN